MSGTIRARGNHQPAAQPKADCRVHTQALRGVTKAGWQLRANSARSAHGIPPCPWRSAAACGRRRHTRSMPMSPRGAQAGCEARIAAADTASAITRPRQSHPAAGRLPSMHTCRAARSANRSRQGPRGRALRHLCRRRTCDARRAASAPRTGREGGQGMSTCQACAQIIQLKCDQKSPTCTDMSLSLPVSDDTLARLSPTAAKGLARSMVEAEAGSPAFAQIR